MPKLTLPPEAATADLATMEAIASLMYATARSALAEGTSKTANEREAVALRKLLRALGFKPRQAGPLAAAILDAAY